MNREGVFELRDWISDGRGECRVRFSGAPGGKAYLLVNGKILASVKVSDGKGELDIKGLLGRMSEGDRLKVESGNEFLKTMDGETEWVVSKGHPLFSSGGAGAKTGSLIEKGWILNKKGRLVSPTWGEKANAYLRAYKDLSATLGEIGFPPSCVTHGTLLGAMRSGALINGDDDFDCLYIDRSSASIEDARRRRLEVMCALRKSGWTVRLGWRGHIKARRERGKPVDLMPCWRENEKLYIGTYTIMAGVDAEDLETMPIRLHGRTVHALRCAEKFLEHQYGSGWRMPQPEWRFRASPEVKRFIKAFRPREVEALLFGGRSVRRRLEIYWE